MSGRPLGQESGGKRGFWDYLGTDDALMPVHLPMGVTSHGQGPENDSEAHHYECWCADPECPLTLALGHAWASGRKVGIKQMAEGITAKIREQEGQ